ncbi:hypothetical protein D0469_01370 [Peribacillus saganii]|uniref:Uncharacterized protein n=1 Tax=Peribacillus saganii TaxID=2303992 RepID=A0A372LTX9_9BACI|nr:hypothetical protein D0469_01370 [Peribacillus saganii]
MAARVGPLLKKEFSMFVSCKVALAISIVLIKKIFHCLPYENVDTLIKMLYIYKGYPNVFV